MIVEVSREALREVEDDLAPIERRAALVAAFADISTVLDKHDAELELCRGLFYDEDVQYFCADLNQAGRHDRPDEAENDLAIQLRGNPVISSAYAQNCEHPEIYIMRSPPEAVMRAFATAATTGQRELESLHSAAHHAAPTVERDPRVWDHNKPFNLKDWI